MKNKPTKVSEYRSSSITIFYRCLGTLLFGASLLMLILIWYFNGYFLREELIGITITIFWAFSWLTIFLTRLKSVEANLHGLIIKRSGGHFLVDYKDIDWIFQPVLISPVLISMKYRDRDTGKSKEILVIPEKTFQNFSLNLSSETEMTRFIKKQVATASSSFATEPLRWHPIGFMFLTGLPGIFFFT